MIITTIDLIIDLMEIKIVITEETQISIISIIGIKIITTETTHSLIITIIDMIIKNRYISIKIESKLKTTQPKVRIHSMSKTHLLIQTVFH